MSKISNTVGWCSWESLKSHNLKTCDQAFAWLSVLQVFAIAILAYLSSLGVSKELWQNFPSSVNSLKGSFQQYVFFMRVLYISLEMRSHRFPIKCVIETTIALIAITRMSDKKFERWLSKSCRKLSCMPKVLHRISPNVCVIGEGCVCLETPPYERAKHAPTWIAGKELSHFTRVGIKHLTVVYQRVAYCLSRTAPLCVIWIPGS